MKHFTLFGLAALLSVATAAQTPYGRDKVVEVDTVSSAAILQATARKWFIDTFKDANEVIQMDDPATNTIIGKGWSEYGAVGALHYTIEVACKKGRARIRIYDVTHKGVGSLTISGATAPYPSFGLLFDQEHCYSNGDREKRVLKVCANLRPGADAEIDPIMASLEKALLSPKAATSDW